MFLVVERAEEVIFRGPLCDEGVAVCKSFFKRLFFGVWEAGGILFGVLKFSLPLKDTLIQLNLKNDI